jgi:hypothetical protein
MSMKECFHVERPKTQAVKRAHEAPLVSHLNNRGSSELHGRTSSSPAVCPTYDGARQASAAVSSLERLWSGGTGTATKVIFARVDHDASTRQTAQLGSRDDKIHSNGTGRVRPDVPQIAGVSRRRVRTSVALVARVVMRTASRAAFSAEISALVDVEAVLSRRNPPQSNHDLHSSGAFAEEDASRDSVHVECGHRAFR